MEIVHLVEELARAWSVPERDRRRRLLEGVCRPDAEFFSPNGANRGLEEYARGIDVFRVSFPRARILHGRADAHHGFVRFGWTTEWNDGRPPLHGVDFGELADDGRLLRLVSFTDPPTAQASDARGPAASAEDPFRA